MKEIIKYFECIIKENSGRYARIDLEINNLATVISNVRKHFIMNVKVLTSMQIKGLQKFIKKISTHLLTVLTKYVILQPIST